MGMLTVKPQFAERIIEKYFGMVSYYFDDSSLVFYRERGRAGGGASSAYNTELTLKLLLMFQNYKYSGQRLSVNWNMINNAVMKTAAGMSYRMEQSIREIFSRSETELNAWETRVETREARAETQEEKLERLQSVIFDLLCRNAAQNRSGRPELKIIGSIGKERLRIRQDRSREENIRPEHITGWLKSLEDDEAAQVYEAVALAAPKLYRQMRHLEVTPAKQRKLLILMAEENPEEFPVLVKKALKETSGFLTGDAAARDFVRAMRSLAVLFRKYEKQIFTGDFHGVMNQDGDKLEKSRIFKNIETIIDSASIRPEEVSAIGKELLGILKHNYLSESNTFDISGEDRRILELSENAVWVFRENPQALGRLRELIDRLDESHRERLRVWSESCIQQEQMLNQIMTVLERIKTNQTIKTSEMNKSAGFENGTETIHKAGKELTEILADVIESSRQYYSQNKIWDTSKDAITVLKENPQSTVLFWELIGRADVTQKEKLREWAVTWGHPAKQRPLAERVMTIMESRFSEPGLAKQAEKELFDILIHDFSMEENRLIWKKEGRQEPNQGKKQREQEKIKLFLSSRENVEYLQKRIESTSEVRRERLKEWVNRYQNVLSGPKEKSRLEETKKLISENRAEAVVRLLQSENRLEREKQELVAQVRRTLGETSAQQLEQYFNRKNRVSGQELKGQVELRTDKTVRNIIDAYIGIKSKEDTLNRLNPGGYVHLENRLREEVHEPVSETVEKNRQNLDILTSILRRDYNFNQEQSRFFSILTEQIGEDAETLLLRHGPGGQHRTAKEVREEAQARTVLTNRWMTEVLRKARGDSEETLHARKLGQAGLEPSGLSNRTVRPETLQNGFANEWGEARTEFLKRQSSQETRLEETRTKVVKLNEKLELQEKLVAELKKQPRQISAPQLDMNVLTKQIMKKMESELRLEKMRRGLL